jgi:phenylacetate-CoA ligase
MSDGHAPELSVIAPCLNEEANVPELAARTLGTFDDHAIDGELVLIDDGSRDATWERIEAATAADPRVRGVRHSRNHGIEAGWKSGLGIARGELVCLIDSDLQNPPEDVARLLATWRAERPGMVQGVRHTRGKQSRTFFSHRLNEILNVAFGMRQRDNKSGFVLCRRETLVELLEHRYRYRYFQCFVGAACGVRGIRIVEVDTDFEPRKAGTSFLSDYPFGVSLRVLGEVAKYRVETWLERPRRTRVSIRPPRQ